MWRAYILIFFLSTSFQLSAQILKVDTLKASFKTRGVLDSLDCHANFFSLPYVPFGLNSFPSETVIMPGNQLIYDQSPTSQRIIFSALPHIGFGYSFGQQGTQLLTANYQQLISSAVLINADIVQNKSTGFQRNSLFNDFNYRALMRISRGKVENISSIEKSTIVNNWSGGLTNDSLLFILPQTLVSVNKVDAFSKTSTTVLMNNFRYNLLKKETTTMGLQVAGAYSTIKRFYHEEGDLALIYPMVNVDSSETADSISLTRMKAKAGFFYENINFKFLSHISLENWQSKTLGRSIDTNELSLDHYLEYKGKKWSFLSKGVYGIYGNFSSLDLQNNVSGRYNLLTLNFNNQFSLSPPTPFLRDYRGNTLDYFLSAITLQQTMKFGAEAIFRKSFFFAQLGGDYIQSKNAYYFNSVNWTNVDNPLIDVYKLKGRTGINFKHLVGVVSYQFTSINEELRYIPQHQASIRFALKTGLFKDGRLKSILGFDAYILSAHKRLVYSPSMGAFDIAALNTQESLPGFYSLGCFANFNVNQFRFFVRMDNISYYWVNKRIPIIEGYYYPLPQFKLGISWDFWN